MIASLIQFPSQCCEASATRIKEDSAVEGELTRQAVSLRSFMLLLSPSPSSSSLLLLQVHGLPFTLFVIDFIHEKEHTASTQSIDTFHDTLALAWAAIHPFRGRFNLSLHFYWVKSFTFRSSSEQSASFTFTLPDRQIKMKGESTVQLLDTLMVSSIWNETLLNQWEKK